MAKQVKQLREQREFETIYSNPKSARVMWAKNVYERYSQPALKPIIVHDKDGNVTAQSQIELAIWEQLKEELENKGLDRLPTDGEMTEACQAYYSRHNSSSYVARRDTMGAKPVDESKQSHTVNNPFDDFTDEELLIMEKALTAARAGSIESPVPDLSKYIEIERRD